ncbi:MAG TPA: ABC transporter substrate-binding protein [Acetobacteraceae bacterium]|nr:ABC transporter substrate-binding protein [Acetobacteraceae bacterium]
MDHASSRLFVTRRQAVRGGAALAVAPALAMPFVGDAEAAAPLKIGMVLAKTGSLVDQSEYLAAGTVMALEEANNTVLGRPCQIVWLDEPTPQAAQQNMQKLIQEQRVIAVIGGALSSDALAMESVAGRLKMPFVITNAAAREITGRDCNRYTFRLQPDVPVQARVLSPYLMGYGRKWYFITANYAFGQDIRRTFQDLLKAAGGSVVGDDQVPLGTPDYSSFILKIREAKPDMILGGIVGGDLSTFLKQWNELGMKGKIPFAEIAIGDTDIWGVGPEAATGIFTSMWWYKNPANTPEEQNFAAAYLKRHGKPAADKAWMGWIGMRSLLGGIELAKSTAPAAIVRGLESWRTKVGDLEVGYRKFDHQLVLRTLVIETKPKITDKWDYFDVKAALPKTAAELPAVFGSEQEVGCHMAAI